ncbi:Man1-Src1p-C-terminal domain-containing protein [Mycena rosella]|uniref:Man1-Src1p-C-terminal domain-containing protein n=1 Tax=Mycena rosella TaxID=1033263 RepID=A0AAD7H1A9_MYCRO|nr:Man1-Src1p-C-terminal domain-containing protein [Mycena rosella]
MSRLTSAQIIGQGHYLEPDFEPASLTVSQLLGVLGYHNVVYPSPPSKPKLIALFNAEIKPKASKFKKERIKAAASIASDDGITDGHTGEPLTGARQPPVVRRSSRRLSRAPSQEQPEVSPVRPDPPKRRRSSAQPNLGGPSRRIEPVEPVVVEESEPEEEELPVRKIGRSKKTAQAAGEQGRRVSHTEDSGWEDNNVFQSGAESSSPARPRPKPTRKSLVPRKTRKSVSAPPEMLLPSSSPTRAKDEPMYSPPQSKFEPQLPPSITREPRLVAPKFTQTTFVPQEHPQPKEEQQETDIGDTDFADDGPTEDFGDGGQESSAVDEEDEEEDHNTMISRRIAEGGNQVAIRQAPTERPGAMSILLRIVFVLVSLASSGVVLNYKLESATIGYCDAGRPTNNALEALRTRRLSVEACNRDNSTVLADGTPCPLPALPLPHPDACTPCPEHGTCTQFSVACDTGYLMRPHPLLFFLPAESTAPAVWRAVGNATDGLPWLGSVGLPPRCAEDPRRKQRIGALGKAVEAELGQVRGRHVCAGSRGPPPIPDADGGEARRWGYEVDYLAGKMRAKTSEKKLSDPDFQGLYNEAIQQLSEWGGIIIGEDARSGKRYVALKTSHLTWDCVVLVKSRAVWGEWRATVYGLVALILGGTVTRARRARSAVEGQRVAGLVQTALDTLRAQERAYHADPVTAAQPYLSSLQLRDVVLADEHLPARARLWARVERVVEENANVRANLEEVDGGDEMRVWRWVGAPSPTKRIE